MKRPGYREMYSTRFPPDQQGRHRLEQPGQAARVHAAARAAGHRGAAAVGVRDSRGRRAAPHLRRERARQGAPCEPHYGPARARRRLGPLRARRWTARRACISAYFAGRGQREERDARNNAALRRSAARPRRPLRRYYYCVLVLVRSPDDPTPARRRRALARRRSCSSRAARAGSATTRISCLPGSSCTAAELDGRAEEPHQPPRPGARRADRRCAWKEERR